MADSEGVIQFAYNLESPKTLLDDHLFKGLNAWRRVFKDLDLIGQDPERYGGLGFGNVSARDPNDASGFVITASQTGRLKTLTPRHYVQITGYNLDRFWIDAEGDRPPSSEALTHAALYSADARIDWIFHGHSPDIFERAEMLKLPTIPEHVTYGSPAMAQAVTDLLESNMSRPIIFISLGHTDGVFACGPTSRDAGSLLVTTLARAFL